MNKAIFSPVMLFLFPLTCLGDTVPSVPPSMFEVLPNETRVISRPDQMPDAIDYLVMRKNSTLLVKPKVGNWKLTARYGYFEKGSKIVAKGHGYNSSAANGGAGGNGGNCHTGKRAGNGANGARGGNGANVELNVGIASFGDLTIDTSGGKGQGGGNGGRGGAGGRADISEMCKGGSGGYGGNGGRGGNGGNAGNVKFIWWEVRNFTPNLGTGNLSLGGLKIIAEGGNPGQGGSGGEGGSGGPGRCKKVIAAKVCRGSGPTGTSGSPGASGSHGSKGKVEVIYK